METTSRKTLNSVVSAYVARISHMHYVLSDRMHNETIFYYLGPPYIASYSLNFKWTQVSTISIFLQSIIHFGTLLFYFVNFGFIMLTVLMWIPSSK